MDKTTEILIEALRTGSRDGGDVRLFRAGKLPGLFPARTTLHAEIAAQALRDGLLETVRSDVKGKTTTEWVRVTQAGVDFLLQQESPLRVLHELRSLLAVSESALPGFLADLQKRIATFQEQVVREVVQMQEQLGRFSARLDAALKRVEVHVPEGAAGALPWDDAALAYLQQRQSGGLGARCPLPELFAAIQDKEPELTMYDFHSGLRRLHDRGVIGLFAGDGSDALPEPEYALLDGPHVYYFAGVNPR